MKNVKEIKPDGFYVFEGRSSANSSMFESLTEAREFLHSANQRLHNYVKIHDYMLAQDSWTMLCEVESEEKITASYLQSKKKKIETSPEVPIPEVWRIISEQIRHLLSRFVKYCNFRQGRTGSKVHSSYKRYWFETYEEALAYIEALREQRYRNSQQMKKYRPRKSHFFVGKKERKGHVLLCSKSLRDGSKGRLFGDGGLVCHMLATDVLRELIISTIELHSTKNQAHFTPQIE